MVQNKVFYRLEADTVFKCLQTWRHNYVIGRNEYFVITYYIVGIYCSIRCLYSVQVWCKSTHYSEDIEENCDSERVCLSEHSVDLYQSTLFDDQWRSQRGGLGV